MSGTVLAAAMTEDELLTAITETATWHGWRWHHIRRSDRAQQMGHSGFPDLVLAKRPRVLYLELKTQAGTVSPDQAAWMDALPGFQSYVIRPSDLDLILRELAS